MWGKFVKCVDNCIGYCSGEEINLCIGKAWVKINVNRACIGKGQGDSIDVMKFRETRFKMR